MPPAKPVANFAFSPREPRANDAVQVFDCSHDPGEVGIAWRAWDFGDGETSVGPSPIHRYTAAGEFEITLTLATFDGRVSQRCESVQVRG